MKISAVIITKNESANIAKCISALKWADEVIVVDSGSTDNTIEIAQSLGAHVESIQWKSYGHAKNHGNKIAQNDWILSIDADEIVPPELAKEIQSLSYKNNTVYALKRVNHLLEKRINYAWSKDYVWRLFDKKTASWSLDEVHEQLIFHSSIHQEIVSNHLLHFSYSSMDDYKKRTELYAQLKAQKWITNQQNPSLLKRAFGSYFKAFHTLFIKMGILDGRAGWTIAKMNFISVKKQLKYFDELTKQ